MDLERESLKYFSRADFIRDKIVSQEQRFIKYFGNTWNELPQERKDALLDSLFVEDDIRGKYADWKENECCIQESFPRLFINSGQKINVDFENDLWTWRDEHSGPFSWMSRSQQDLTLADLEPENISKPQPKQPRKDLDDETNFEKPEMQFTHPSNSWCHDVIDGYKKCEPDIVLTPSVSIDFAPSRASSEDKEEINQAFSSSCDDLSTQSSPAREIDEESTQIQTISHDTENGIHAQNHSDIKSKSKKKEKDRGRKSPSPIKILRSGSFKKTHPKKCDDQGEEKLIDRKDANSKKGEPAAYTNPALCTEWSPFVGDEQPQHQNGPSVDSVSHTKPVINSAPESLVIDRGLNSYSAGSSSPYRGDNIKLIQPEDSPVPSPYLPSSRLDPSLNVSSPIHSEWSGESTPDHTTHLLKGLQSPEHHASLPINRSSQYVAIASDDHAKSKIPQEVEQTEHEEILTVEMQGDQITVTSQIEEKRDSKRDSDIPVTGFDFLDNW